MNGDSSVPVDGVDEELLQKVLDASPATEKQRRVIEAALDVFVEKGFAGASTAEIAKKAGVAEGTLFKQYKTKKDLLIGVVAPLLARFVAPTLIKDVRAIFDDEHANVEALLTALYTDRLAFIRAHQRMMRIAIQELPFHADVRDQAKGVVLRELWPSVSGAIRRLQAKGEIIDGDPATIMRMFVASLFSYVIVRDVLAPERAWDDAREIGFMIGVLSRGLKPPSST